MADSSADPRLRTARSLAEVLDRAFRIPGTRWRFGVDPLIGLVPGVGDLFAGGFAGYLILAGARLGAPPAVLARMVLNVAIDAGVGTIPFAGDLFDAGFKANIRNLHLLERWLESPGEARRASRAILGALLTALFLIVLAAVTVAILVTRWVLGLFA
jgi:hypothetical protein